MAVDFSLIKFIAVSAGSKLAFTSKIVFNSVELVPTALTQAKSPPTKERLAPLQAYFYNFERLSLVAPC